MAAEFQPLSSLAPNLLVEYLAAEGKSRELVEWKYFDAAFGRGRERGYAWVKDGVVGGFIGLIPFELALGERRVAAAWTCDWSMRGGGSSGGNGILLIKQAHASYPVLAQIGGNENTRYIVSRLAAMSVADAGVVFHLPLRAGAVLRMLRRRLPGLPVDALDLLNRVPLPGAYARAPRDAAMFEAGVSKIMDSILNRARHGESYPIYDFEYVQWQIGRCPSLACESCYTAGESNPRAGALIWRDVKSSDLWRMAIWPEACAETETDVLLGCVVRRVYEQGGFLLSVAVSRLDTGLIGALRRRGFMAAPRRRPLYVMASKKTGEPIPELWPLSFLDTDFAHRF